MSHGILENDNLIYVGEKPWHGLGRAFKRGEEPSVKEAIVAANLDWEVELQEIQTNTGIKLGDRRAIIRKDTNDCLGVLTNSYKPLQNKDAFDFFEPFIENDMAKIETAGSLFNGKRVFITAKLNSENLRVSDEDQIEKYILLSNSHDGSQALKVGFVPVRVVCNNTLTQAESDGASSLIRVYHKGDVVQSMNDLQEAMDLVNQRFAMSEEKYRYLATKNVSVADLKKYVKEIFYTNKVNKIVTEYEQEQEEKEQIESARKRLLNRVEEIFELEPVHNAWTMYNSVNYYLNHERGRSLESRYDSMWFGYSKRMDEKAFNLAMKY